MKKDMKMEKIVPVIATGLVIGALSSVEVFAEDGVEQSSSDHASDSTTESRETASAPSTDISHADRTTDSDGGSSITVNSGVDVSNDSDGGYTASSTSSGTLNSTTEQGDSSETTTPGTPSTSTTTNPDGSTTTTTTTPTTTTTTENSQTTIDGVISTEPSEATDEAKEDIKTEVGEILDSSKNDENSGGGSTGDDGSDAENVGGIGSDEGTEGAGGEGTGEGTEGAGNEGTDEGTEGAGGEGTDEGTEGAGGEGTDEGTEGTDGEGSDEGTEGADGEGSDEGTDGDSEDAGGDGSGDSGDTDEDGDAPDSPADSDTGFTHYDWDAFAQNLKDKYGESAEVTYDEEQDAHVATFVTTTEAGKPLTEGELATVLGVELTRVEGQENTYTYMDGDAVVTIVVSDNSTENTTTEWTVTITEKVKSESSDANNTFVDVAKPGSGEVQAGSAQDVLDNAEKLKDGESASQAGGEDNTVIITVTGANGETVKTITKDQNGDIVKIEEGSKTYKFTYEVIEEFVDIGELSNEQILKLLPANGEFSLGEDGKIYKEGIASPLDFSNYKETLLAKAVDVVMTVIDAHGSQEQHVQGDKEVVRSEARDQALKEALKKAFKSDGIEFTDEDFKASKIIQILGDAGESGSNGNRSAWLATATVEKDGNLYTYTARVDVSEESSRLYKTEIPEDVLQNLVYNKENGNPVGGTTTVTGSATVTGGTIIWNKQGETMPFHDKNGFVNIEKGDTTTDGETVQSVTKNADGKTVTIVTQKGNVTKTYTFKYEALTDDEKEALLGEGEKTDFEGLVKATWTVEVSTDNRVTEKKDETVIAGAGGNLWKNGTGNYTYKDGDKTIIFSATGTKEGDRTVYVEKVGDTTYTIEEMEFPFEDGTSKDIEDILGSKYGEVTVDKDGVIHVTNEDGEAVIIGIGNSWKLLTVTKESVKESDCIVTTTASNSDDAVKWLLGGIKGNIETAGKDAIAYFEIGGAGYALTIKDGELVQIDNNKIITLDEADALKKALKQCKSNKVERSYSVTLTIKSVETDSETASSLTVNSLTTGGITTVEGEGGNKFIGSYYITQVKDLDEEVKKAMLASGHYHIYSTYVTTTETDDSLTGTKYGGRLDYTYKSDETDILVSGSTTLDRNVNVQIDSTSVSSRPGAPIVDSVTTPAQGGGTGSGSGSSGGSGGGGTGTGGGSGTTASTPSSPSTVTVADGDVPLGEMPDLASPDMEIPDSVVPLLEMPDGITVTDEAVPLAYVGDAFDISDGAVPLADVPLTGDHEAADAMALAAVCAGGILLGMRKKREE